MRTVKKRHLSFVVRSLARNEKNIQPSLICREFSCNRLRSLDYPKMEDFALYHEVVAVSDSLMNLINGILRIAWHNAVNQCTIYSASLLEPSLEILAELPEFDVLVDALLEFLAIEEDQFTWKDDESLALVPVEMIVPAVKKLGKFARI